MFVEALEICEISTQIFENLLNQRETIISNVPTKNGNNSKPEEKVLIKRTYIPGINNATFIIVQVIYKFQIPSIYSFGKGQRIRSTETS